MAEPKFDLGNVVSTPGALGLGVDLRLYLARHVRGEWGDLDDEDKAANERALVGGGRILSAYDLGEGKKLWVITEADRSVTTFLLPSEY